MEQFDETKKFLEENHYCADENECREMIQKHIDEYGQIYIGRTSEKKQKLIVKDYQKKYILTRLCIRFIYHNDNIEDIIRFEGKLIKEFKSKSNDDQSHGGSKISTNDKDTLIYIIYPEELDKSWMMVANLRSVAIVAGLTLLGDVENRIITSDDFNQKVND